MIWSVVAQRHMESFERAREQAWVLRQEKRSQF
jgi:hypothetical protein